MFSEYLQVLLRAYQDLQTRRHRTFIRARVMHALETGHTTPDARSVPRDFKSIQASYDQESLT